jgi:DNA-binding transcriptional LysR family regulator
MKITSHQLSAFFETAKLRSFSKAANALGVTQSALSQRIANLEDDLEVTLFIRDPAGPILTTAGELLLRHCQVTDSLEQEVLGQLKSSTKQFSGAIRIAGFSSVLRSVIIPALAPFLRAHGQVHCEFRSFEVAELHKVLKTAEADLVILDYHLKKSDIVEHVLGREEYVVIESSKFSTPPDLYLDHGPHDNATESFFNEQVGAPKTYRRSFMGDVYGIINGVELGLGRAVMSKHLLKGNSRVKMVRGYKRYFRNVTLNYFEQPYYSRLHKEVVAQLEKSAPEYL